MDDELKDIVTRFSNDKIPIATLSVGIEILGALNFIIKRMAEDESEKTGVPMPEIWDSWQEERLDLKFLYLKSLWTELGEDLSDQL